ncbi:MAG TPA: hypothetical protein VG755_41995 [Nannocystaceae bacterium]|nr:hypothetical protein [Nannocystaceae bacterium]
MIGAAALCGLAVLWWLVAVMMRQPARGAGRLLSFGLFVYLGVAVGGTAARVMAQPPPVVEAPSGPPVVISANTPSADAKHGDAKGDAKNGDAKKLDAKADAPRDEGPAPAPVKPSVAIVGEAHVDLPAPTMAGREALRFVDAVSKSDDRCRDVDELAKAAAELPGALSEVSATRAEKSAEKLEACRKKVVWSRAYAIRTARVEDRRKFSDELPARMKREHGLAVLITMRGAADERIRIGGGGLDEAKAKSLLDGGLRDELVSFGFEEVVIANMKTSYKEDLDAPSDTQLAERELGPKGLDRKIALP